MKFTTPKTTFHHKQNQITINVQTATTTQVDDLRQRVGELTGKLTEKDGVVHEKESLLESERIRRKSLDEKLIYLTADLKVSVFFVEKIVFFDFSFC